MQPEVEEQWPAIIGEMTERGRLEVVESADQYAEFLSRHASGVAYAVVFHSGAVELAISPKVSFSVNDAMRVGDGQGESGAGKGILRLFTDRAVSRAWSRRRREEFAEWSVGMSQRRMFWFLVMALARKARRS